MVQDAAPSTVKRHRRVFSNASAASTGNDSQDDASVLNTRSAGTSAHPAHLRSALNLSMGETSSLAPRGASNSPVRAGNQMLRCSFGEQGSPSAQSTARGFISSFAAPALQFAVDDDDNVIASTRLLHVICAAAQHVRRERCANRGGGAD